MITYKEVLKMEEEYDILICICNSKGTQIPGKIYYCTGYHKPIIIILDSEYQEDLREYFKTFNRFILCENNVKSITSAIEKAKEKLNVYEYNINKQLTPEYMAKSILSKFGD